MRCRAWLVLAMMLGLVGAVGSTDASAFTATISPASAVTATGSASQFSLDTARRTLNCTSTRFTATLRTGGTFTSFPFQAASDLQWIFSGCRVVGGLTISIGCNPNQSYNLAGVTSGSATPGRIGIDCVPRVTGANCTVEIIGSVPVTYSNTGSSLTVQTTGSPGQLLLAQGSDDGTGTRPCSSLPNDSRVTFSDSSGAAFRMTVSPVQTITVS